MCTSDAQIDAQIDAQELENFVEHEESPKRARLRSLRPLDRAVMNQNM